MSEQTSAFTREDFGSNRLGAEFGTYLLKRGDNCHSLSDALLTFLEQYAPLLEGKASDYEELPKTQKELDSHSADEIRRMAIENRIKYAPHGFKTIYTRSKPKSKP